MPGFSIRRGTASDRAEVCKIAFAIMPLYGLEPDPEGLDSDLGRFGANDPGTLTELVAEANGRVIGSIVLRRQTDTRAKLSGFYVHPKFRGQGVGKALLQELLEEAKAAGIKQIYLETWSSMAEAVHLYESLGWVRGEPPPAASGADSSYCRDL